MINKSGILGCLDKTTGKELYRKRLGFECWATPVASGNQLFVFGKNGAAMVIEAGSSFNKVAENQLWDLGAPPKPVSYREHYPSRGGEQSHGHGGAGPDAASHGKPGQAKQGSHANPGSSMLARFMAGDKDGDGSLSGDEIPGRLRPAMDNIDLNKDGKLDKSELSKMAEQFAARRKNSRNNSRDPIVYGVAADSKGFLVRTGTRLFSLTKEE